MLVREVASGSTPSAQEISAGKFSAQENPALKTTAHKKHADEYTNTERKLGRREGKAEAEIRPADRQRPALRRGQGGRALWPPRENHRGQARGTRAVPR